MRKGLWELSVPSLQLFCEYKTILKVKVYFKNVEGDGDTEIWNQFSRALGPQLLLHWFDTVVLKVGCTQEAPDIPVPGSHPLPPEIQIELCAGSPEHWQVEFKVPR